jgi:DNA polymerase-3 subunit alpha
MREFATLELLNKLRASKRSIPNEKWVDDEVRAIRDSKLADRYLDLLESGKKYENPNHSSVAYLLGFTDECPTQYPIGLTISGGRPDWPDADMDFEHTRREEMKNYMEERWGEKLGLATYTRFQAKGLILKIASALAIPLAEVTAANKHYNDLKEYESGDATALKTFRTKYPEVGIYAKALEGHITSSGAHAAAVVIADRPMTDIVPVESRTDPEDKKKRIPISAWDMHDAEEAGLIKFDFLGLNTLSVIHSCVDLIKDRHGTDIDWESLEPDDAAVLHDLDGAHTSGVFQMESSAYRKLLSDMGVSSFQDAVASNALVRPGAFDTVAKDYIRRKKGLEPVTYPHPDAEEWLKDSYGVVIYQEQVMAMSVVIGGFTWAEANKLRKIIGKKRDVSEFKQYEDKWIEGATKKISLEEAWKLWHDFEKHANYSFNLSHAVCYSYMSYVTAWFKHYYPLEYMYSLLKHEVKDTTKMSYLLEAKRGGIKILGPDVNISDSDMMVDGDALRFGLGDIKNVGVTASKFIIEKRPWTTWEDWSERIEARKVNSRVTESLVAVDALRSIADAPHNSEPEKNYMEYLNYPVDLESVAELGIEYEPIENYEEGGEQIIVCGVVKNVKRTDRYMRMELEDITGSLTCFGANGNDLANGELVIALIGDKSMMGYARIDGFKERMELGTTTGFENLLLGKMFDDYKPLRRFNIGGINDDKSLVVPLSIRRITTKAGKKMAFVNITDGEQVVKLTVFPDSWAQYENLIREYEPIVVKLNWLQDGGQTLARGDSLIGAADLMNKTKDK